MFRLERVVHQGPYKADPYVETFKLLHEAGIHKNPVLCDRLHLGEQVYGPIFRGRNMLTDECRIRLEKVMHQNYRPVVIVCLPPLDRILPIWRSRVNAGLEMLTKEEQFVATYDAYQKGQLQTELRTIWYDYTRQTPDQLAKLLEEVRPKW